MFFYEYVFDVIVTMIFFTIYICHVHVFSWIFFSWLTCLWFNSSLISKSTINHYKLFLNKHKSVFSLNTNLNFFLNKHRFVFSLNIDLKIFLKIFLNKKKNWSVFSLNIDLKIFPSQKLICIFIKYISENFSKTKTYLYFH